MNLARRLTRCSEVGPLLVFYACDEVEPREREQIEAHLASCAGCAEQLREEREMHAALMNAFQPADQIDPSGALLAQCRSELSELLDDLSAPPLQEQWSPFGWARRWMALRPVWSAACLVLVGVLAGAQIAARLANRDGSGNSAVNVKAAPVLTNDDLSKMNVAGIFPVSSDPSSGTVQLQVRTEQPLVITGSVDDADVRRVLTYVVANGERFDPGVRLDCLDVLKARTGDREVRHALLAAAENDRNAAVRMKALEALRDSTGDADVRDALLQALHHDANPGVRVEAVNMLVRSLNDREQESTPSDNVGVSPEPGPSDAESEVPVDPSVGRVIHALQELQREDPNRYVRLRSAAALRQISPREGNSR
jgi:HEAT repeats/Putative zinc-finger